MRILLAPEDLNLRLSLELILSEEPAVIVVQGDPPARLLTTFHTIRQQVHSTSLNQASQQADS